MLYQRQRVAPRSPKPSQSSSSASPMRRPSTSIVWVLLLVAAAALAFTIYTNATLANANPTAPSVLISPEPEPLPPPPPPSSPPAPPSTIHIGVATDADEPFGLLALVNSTLVNTLEPQLLRFHIVVPGTSRRRLRLLLESLFSQPSFRMYSLDVGGARAKILRHLRRREREPVLISPYRYTLPYLPLVLPQSVRRLLWLQPDVLILSDVREVYDVPLDGAPAGAAEDCSRAADTQFNASRVSLNGALPPGACSLEAGLIVLDLQQWQLLDMTARVEYWLALNLRAASFFAHNDAHAPLTLALLPVFARLPSHWIAGGLGERRASPVETSRLRIVIAPHNRAGAEAPRALHFGGRWKPWLRGAVAQSAGALCVIPPSGREVPCAELWSMHARRAIHTLGWKLPTYAEAAKAIAVATAAAVAGSAEEADPFGPPLIEADSLYAAGKGGADGGDDEGVAADAGAAVHVTIVCSDAAPYGLIALINSTIMHATRSTRARLRLHVIGRDAEHVGLLSAKIGAAFPQNDGGVITVTPPPVERLAKLSVRLAAIAGGSAFLPGISTDAFDHPLLWLPAALPPSEVPRTLLLASDTIVLTDIGELYSATLPPGKACAVVEDCAVLFEGVYNSRHSLFVNKHARSSCTFDVGTMLIDLKQWRKEDVPARLVDMLGGLRKVDGLYLPASASSGGHGVGGPGGGGDTAAAAIMLALDRRALRLPARWLARGLARDGLSFGELQYWERLWGQQGVRVPLTTRPYRAVHAVSGPVRANGDALLLRFSAGPFKPWLRRCGPQAAAAAPLCGRPGVPTAGDCARLWRRFFAPGLAALVEARELDDAGALRPMRGAVRTCVEANIDGMVMRTSTNASSAGGRDAHLTTNPLKDKGGGRSRGKGAGAAAAAGAGKARGGAKRAAG